MICIKNELKTLSVFRGDSFTLTNRDGKVTLNVGDGGLTMSQEGIDGNVVSEVTLDRGTYLITNPVDNMDSLRHALEDGNFQDLREIMGKIRD